MEDPFLLDQNRVESHLESVRHQLQRWRQLRDTEHLPGDLEDREEMEEEFQSLTGELAQSVKSIGWDLDDLQETLQMMLDAKAPQVTSAVRGSRVAFVAKSRSLLDEVAREVAMATTANGSAAAANGVARGGADFDAEAGEAEGPAPHAAKVPLLTWRKDTDQLSFPSVELNSLMDMRKARFHNRDWTGCLYRYRYLLAMLAAVCLIVFLTVVALAAKHTAAAARIADAAAAAAAAASSTAAPMASATPCRHYFCIGGR